MKSFRINNADSNLDQIAFYNNFKNIAKNQNEEKIDNFAKKSRRIKNQRRKRSNRLFMPEKDVECNKVVKIFIGEEEINEKSINSNFKQKNIKKGKKNKVGPIGDKSSSSSSLSPDNDTNKVINPSKVLPLSNKNL